MNVEYTRTEIDYLAQSIKTNQNLGDRPLARKLFNAAQMSKIGRQKGQTNTHPLRYRTFASIYNRIRLMRGKIGANRVRPTDTAVV